MGVQEDVWRNYTKTMISLTAWERAMDTRFAALSTVGYVGALNSGGSDFFIGSFSPAHDSSGNNRGNLTEKNGKLAQLGTLCFGKEDLHAFL